MEKAWVIVRAIRAFAALCIFSAACIFFFPLPLCVLCPCSLASTLSSASNPGILRAVRHRFDERTEARAGVAKATEEAKTEKESRTQADQAHKDAGAALHREVGVHVDPLVDKKTSISWITL